MEVGNNEAKICSKKVIRNYSTTGAHQRIDDHEKLCRIMQQETNRKIEQNGKKN